MLTRRTLALTLTALLLGALTRADDKAKENKIPDETKAILDKADSFELLSLDPMRDKEVKDGFHGWKVLGKTEVKDADTRKGLVAALAKGAADNKGEVARCFNPRHGIRATHDKKAVDLVICFECLQVRVYPDKGEGEGFLTTAKPQAEFDKVLKAADVPLAKPADE
jgi:hypothetical protein